MDDLLPDSSFNDANLQGILHNLLSDEQDVQEEEKTCAKIQVAKATASSLESSVEFPEDVETENVNKRKQDNETWPKSKKPKNVLTNNEDFKNNSELKSLQSKPLTQETTKTDDNIILNTNKDWYSQSEHANWCMICDKEIPIRDKINRNHYKIYHGENYISRLSPKQLHEIKNHPQFALDKTPKEIIYNKKWFYECPFCQKTFSKRMKCWLEHFQNHTAEFRNECSNCYKGNHWENKIRAHISLVCKGAAVIHSDVKLTSLTFIEAHVCNLCNFIQLKRENLERHYIQQHKLPERDVASLGNKIKLIDAENVKILSNAEAKTASDFLELEPQTQEQTKTDDNIILNTNKDWHSQSEHANWCTICEEEIPIRDNITKNHYKIYHGENYISRLSPKQLNELKSHPRIAIDKTPKQKHKKKWFYECPFCQKTFTKQILLWQGHFLRHTAEFRYECSNCHRGNNNETVMHDHISRVCKGATVIHSDVKLITSPTSVEAHVCNLCNFIQLSRENLERHFIQQHKERNVSSLGYKIKLMNAENVKILSNDEATENITASSLETSVEFPEDVETENVNKRKQDNEPCPKSKKPKNFLTNNEDLKNNSELKSLQSEPQTEEQTKTDDNIIPNTNKDWHSQSEHVNWCKICEEEIPIRDNITKNHYKIYHGENYISRLSPKKLNELKSHPRCAIDKTPKEKYKKKWFYECPFCQEKFTKQMRAWEVHFRNHTAEFQYECSNCHRGNNDETVMHGHISRVCEGATVIHSDVKLITSPIFVEAHVCNLCNFIQLSRENLERHFIQQHKERNVASLGYTIKLIGGENEKIVSKNKLANTNKDWHSRSKYIDWCMICEKEISEKNKVSKNHYKMYHGENYISRLSPKQLHEIKNHPRFAIDKTPKETYYNKKWFYECSFCQKGFTKPRHWWLEHFLNHTAEYRYECSKCHRGNYEMTEIRYHISRIGAGECKGAAVVHSDIKLTSPVLIEAHVCNLCNFIQLKRENLERHFIEQHKERNVASLGYKIKLMDAENVKILSNDEATEILSNLQKDNINEKYTEENSQPSTTLSLFTNESTFSSNDEPDIHQLSSSTSINKSFSSSSGQADSPINGNSLIFSSNLSAIDSVTGTNVDDNHISTEDASDFIAEMQTKDNNVILKNSHLEYNEVQLDLNTVTVQCSTTSSQGNVKSPTMNQSHMIGDCLSTAYSEAPSTSFKNLRHNNLNISVTSDTTQPKKSPLKITSVIILNPQPLAATIIPEVNQTSWSQQIEEATNLAKNSDQSEVYNMEHKHSVSSQNTTQRVSDNMTSLPSSLIPSTSSWLQSNLNTSTKSAFKIFCSYILEAKRFTCNFSDCSYLSKSEEEFHEHLSTYHSTAKKFRCSFCQRDICKRGIVIDHIIKHLRFHSSTLYRCDECNYFDHRRCVVETHINDTHATLKVNIVTHERSIEDNMKGTISITSFKGNKYIDITEPNQQLQTITRCSKDESCISSKDDKESEKYRNKLEDDNVETAELDEIEMQYQITTRSSKRKSKISSKDDEESNQYTKKPDLSRDIDDDYNELTEELDVVQTQPPQTTISCSSRESFISSEDDEESKDDSKNLKLSRDNDDNKNTEEFEDDNRPTEELDATNTGYIMNYEYCCFHCDFKTPKLDDLKTQHYETLHNNSQEIAKPFWYRLQGRLCCTECRQFIGNNSELEKHLANKHNTPATTIAEYGDSTQRLLCGYCSCPIDPKEVPIDNTKQIMDILKLDTSATSYVCKLCADIFPNTVAIVHHYCNEHADEDISSELSSEVSNSFIYRCAHCVYTSTKEEDLLRHMIDHYGSFKKCHFCHEPQHTFNDYMQHWYDEHKNNKARFKEIYPFTEIQNFLLNMLIVFPIGLVLQKTNLLNTKYGNPNSIEELYEEIYKISQQPAIPKLSTARFIDTQRKHENDKSFINTPQQQTTNSEFNTTVLQSKKKIAKRRNTVAVDHETSFHSQIYSTNFLQIQTNLPFKKRKFSSKVASS